MSNGVLERLTALRHRLAVLRDGTQSERVRACTVKDMALIEEAESELIRLQTQENWAHHQEQEIGRLRDQIEALGIEPVVTRRAARA